LIARDTSDIAEMEATFLRFIGARDLRVARWEHDGAVVAYSARAPAPGGERMIVWERAAGNATLHSFCIYHRQYHPNIPVPYNVAMVQLAEGPLLISTVVIDDPAALRVGMALRAAFEPSGRLVFHAITEPEGLP
jgi:uncharacterized OB-fold protein